MIALCNPTAPNQPEPQRYLTLPLRSLLATPIASRGLMASSSMYRVIGSSKPRLRWSMDVALLVTVKGTQYCWAGWSGLSHQQVQARRAPPCHHLTSIQEL